MSRSPGGDSNLFLNDCIGCHAGLDGLAGAFAFYDFDATAGKLNYTLNAVQPKFVKDAKTFPFGYQDDRRLVDQLLAHGPNAFVGWHGPGSGNGAKSLGMELAQDAPILRVPGEEACSRRSAIARRTAPRICRPCKTIANSFEANNRSMKRVFADTAVYCMGAVDDVASTA